MIKNIIFSGGSIKGVSFLGILKYLYENEEYLNNIECVAGSSVGSIFAIFLCLKIDYEKILKYIQEIDYSDCLDFDLEELFENYGLDNCNNFISVLINILEEYKDLTFLDCYEKYNKELIISALNLDSYDIEYFNYKDNPDMKIVDAIRCSISIPFLFTPGIYSNNYYIDAAFLENIPLSIFKDKKEETLGIMITKEINTNKSFNNIENYIYNVMYCIKNYIKKLHNFENEFNIIKININNISLLDFDIDNKQKNELIEIGYNSIKEYFLKLI